MSEVLIYYDDSIFIGEPKDIPSPVGVVAVVTKDNVEQKHYVGRLVLSQYEYYILENGEWFGLFTVTDLVDHVLYKRPEVVLKGRWIPTVRYEEIYNEASNLRVGDWPKKAGTWDLRESGMKNMHRAEKVT